MARKPDKNEINTMLKYNFNNSTHIRAVIEDKKIIIYCIHINDFIKFLNNLKIKNFEVDSTELSTSKHINIAIDINIDIEDINDVFQGYGVPLEDDEDEDWED